MATTVNERLDSGEGDRRGADGHFAAVRRFDVVIDPLDATFRDLNDPVGPTAYLYPIGSPHNVRPELVVADYAHPTRIPNTRGTWIVEVNYKVALVAAGVALADWTLTFDNMSVQTEVARDLDNKAIGGRAFVDPEAGEEHTHYGMSIDGPQPIVARPDAISPSPLPRYLPADTLVAERTLANLSRETYQRVRAYRGFVNDRPFMEVFEPKTMLFSQFRVVRQPGMLTGREQLEPGVLFNITLTFVGDQDKWTPKRLYDRYYYKGYSGDIRTAGEIGTLAYSDFRMVDVANLDEVFTILEGRLRQPRRRRLP